MRRGVLSLASPAEPETGPFGPCQMVVPSPTQSPQLSADKCLSPSCRRQPRVIVGLLTHHTNSGDSRRAFAVVSATFL